MLGMMSAPWRMAALAACLSRNIFAEWDDHRDNTIAEQDQDHNPEILGDEFLSFGEFHIVGI
jgi:hypothetical protein